MLTASVFVNIPVKSIAKAYTYRVPAELSYVGAGWRVFVPFGGRKVEGFILATAEQSAEELGKIQLKDIQDVVDEEAWFSPAMIKAARWLASFYLCSLAEMMRLFMPGKSGLKISVQYAADESQHDHVLLGMPMYQAVYHYLLAEGPRKKTEIGRALPDYKDSLPDILAKLVQYHVLTKEYAAEKRDNARYEKLVVLTAAITPELEAAYKRKKAQLQLLELLAAAKEQTLAMAVLKEQKVSTATVNHLAEAGLVEIRQRRVLRDSYGAVAVQEEQVELTDDQQTALAAMEPVRTSGQYHGFLLKGVTGSGKTQVYIEMAGRVRKAGRQVIVLVPEIALTGQVVMAFKAYFPTDIVVMHSRLSLSERNDAIIRVRRGEAGIIIGARSALFTPAGDIGLIIMDEEQDMSYKQDESPALPCPCRGRGAGADPSGHPAARQCDAVAGIVLPCAAGRVHPAHDADAYRRYAAAGRAVRGYASGTAQGQPSYHVRRAPAAHRGHDGKASADHHHAEPARLFDLCHVPFLR
jgi:primosomal protein N' (replication factor Y)